MGLSPLRYPRNTQRDYVPHTKRNAHHSVVAGLKRYDMLARREHNGAKGHHAFLADRLADHCEGLLSNVAIRDVLAAANLLALGDRLQRWEYFFWISILSAAVVFHPSHLAIVLVLLGAAIIGWLLSTSISPSGVMALAFAAAIGFASEFGFAFAVEKVLHVEVSRPPDLMARIIADGPGAVYLRHRCPQASFLACKFVDRLSQNSDQFLWSDDGVYSPATISERPMLGDEQYQFEAAVLAYDPAALVTAALSDTFQQLKMAGLSFFDGGR